MSKKAFFCIALFLSLFQLKAQSIRGKVVEKESKEALKGASVALFSLPDSTLVTGTTTKEEGIFTIKNLKTGNYYLQVSFVGFENYTSEAFSLNDERSMGTIPLVASQILMDEVVVNGDVVNKLDKKVYRLENDLLSKTGNATEALQNLPAVNVDINGGISLRNAGVTIFLNGKPSALLQRNPTAFLEQLPARMIERIEVITNPSAKYQPDGVGGIINIVLKKETRQGVNGQLSASAGFQHRYNAGLNLNYGTDELNFFGNYGLRHSNPTYFSTDERIFPDAKEEETAQTFEDSRSSTISLSHSLYAGSSWEIDEQNSLELSGNYFRADSDHKGISDIFSATRSGSKNVIFKDRSTNDEHEAEAELQLAMEHVFSNNEDHSLEFEATYATFDEKEDQRFRQEYSMPTEMLLENHNLVEKSGNEEELSLDYVLPLGEDTELEAGYLGLFSYQDIRYTRDKEKTRFLFDQNIHALYAQYSQPVGNFAFKAGLRGEGTFTKAHVKLPKDSLVKNDNFRLFPTLHLQYELNDESLLALSYSRRINRPDADMLNPNPEFVDPRSAEAGNAGLKPEQVHSVELGLQTGKGSYSLTGALYYRYRYDAFTSIKRNIGDSLVIGTVENLNSQQSGGLEINYSKSFGEHWNTALSGDVFYTRLNADNLGYRVRNHGISGNLKAHTYFDLEENTKMQFDAFYYFPSLSPQGKREDIFYLNAGIKEDLFNDKASITLTAIDVFHTYKMRRRVEAADFYQNDTYKRLQPVVLLGFSWRFNNYENSEKIEYGDEGL